MHAVNDIVIALRPFNGLGNIVDSMVLLNVKVGWHCRHVNDIKLNI